MAFHKVEDLPPRALRYHEEAKQSWHQTAKTRGRVIYFQALNLDGLSDAEHSVAFSRLMANAENEFETEIAKAMPGAPAWAVDPLIRAAIDGLHAGYDELAEQDGGAG